MIDDEASRWPSSTHLPRHGFYDEGVAFREAGRLGKIPRISCNTERAGEFIATIFRKAVRRE